MSVFWLDLLLVKFILIRFLSFVIVRGGFV